MMKHSKIYFTIFIFCLGIAQGQNRREITGNSLTRMDLRGPVREMTVEYYDVINYTDGTSELSPEIIGPEHSVYRFDRNGNLQSLTEYTKLGQKKDSLELFSESQYKYDNRGRLLQEEITYPDREEKGYYKYQYSGDTLVTVSIDDRYYFVNITYREEENMEYRIQYNSDSTHITKKRFEYDRFNRLFRQEEYDGDGYLASLYYTTYQDTLTTNKAQEVHYSGDKYFSHMSYRKFEYDQNDDLIRIVNGNFRDDDTTENTFSYKIDHYGNWVERQRFDIKALPFKLTKREIIYYAD